MAHMGIGLSTELSMNSGEKISEDVIFRTTELNSYWISPSTVIELFYFKQSRILCL